jgi:hypothetical protein
VKYKKIVDKIIIEIEDRICEWLELDDYEVIMTLLSKRLHKMYGEDNEN